MFAPIVALLKGAPSQPGVELRSRRGEKIETGIAEPSGRILDGAYQRRSNILVPVLGWDEDARKPGIAWIALEVVEHELGGTDGCAVMIKGDERRRGTVDVHPLLNSGRPRFQRFARTEMSPFAKAPGRDLRDELRAFGQGDNLQLAIRPPSS
jgi:hypothetical protein